MKKLLSFMLLLSGQPLACLTGATIKALSDQLIAVAADTVLDRDSAAARIDTIITAVDAAVSAEIAASPAGGSLGESVRTSELRKAAVDCILGCLATWQAGPGRALIPAHGAGLARETEAEKRLRKIRFDLTHARA